MYQVHCLETQTDNLHMSVMFNVGAVHDARRMTGISHFIEHLMFYKYVHNNATNMSFMKELNRSGTWNAVTTRDYTQFFVNAGIEQMERVVDLMCQLCFFFGVAEEDFEAEKRVILHEKMQRSIGSVVKGKQFFVALHRGDAYSNSLFASRAALGGLRYKDAVAYHSRHYRSPVVVLLLKRSLHKKAMECVERCIQRQSLDIRDKLVDAKKPVVVRVEKNLVTLDKDAGWRVVEVNIGFLLPAFDTARVSCVEMINFMLSRLINDSLRFDKKMIYSASVRYDWYEQCGLIYVSCTCTKPAMMEMVSSCCSIIADFTERAREHYDAYKTDFVNTRLRELGEDQNLLKRACRCFIYNRGLGTQEVLRHLGDVPNRSTVASFAKKYVHAKNMRLFMTHDRWVQKDKEKVAHLIRNHKRQKTKSPLLA